MHVKQWGKSVVAVYSIHLFLRAQVYTIAENQLEVWELLIGMKICLYLSATVLPKLVE